MDQIIHNSYEVLIDGKVSMRERHGFLSNDSILTLSSRASFSN